MSNFCICPRDLLSSSSFNESLFYPHPIFFVNLFTRLDISFRTCVTILSVKWRKYVSKQYMIQKEVKLKSWQHDACGPRF